ncbi:MAG TPA: PilW family protein [Burkholderiales bacterium]|nr:PilW family protein [Burkholderiales bacterium]
MSRLPVNHLFAAARGFTLVEMMVALALGSLLAIVVAQLFANTRTTNRATEDAARVQESMRYAAEVIGRTVRIAGYKSDPRADSAVIFPAAARALDGTNGTGTDSDTLIVRYQGAGAVTGTADNTILDCLGAAVAPDYAGIAKAYNKFSVATGANGRNALFCSTDPAVNPGTELVSGVEAMQVIFGEDTTTAPGDGTADRFVPVGSVTNLDNVVAVRVYLLLSGSESVRLDTAAANYTVGGVAYSYSDAKVRRIVTYTVVLRNRAP